MQCDDEDLREAQAVIRMCNPKPGLAYSEGKSDYVVPDVVVKKLGDEWVVMLNRDVIPRLRVNQLYANNEATTRRYQPQPAASRSSLVN